MFTVIFSGTDNVLYLWAFSWNTKWVRILMGKRKGKSDENLFVKSGKGVDFVLVCAFVLGCHVTLARRILREVMVRDISHA